MYVLSRIHQRPFTQLDKLCRSYLSWSQGSDKSKPCHCLFLHCPVVHAGPQPSSALRISTWILWLACWIHFFSSHVLNLRFLLRDMTAMWNETTEAGERMEGRAVNSSDRWRVQPVAFVSCRSSARWGCQKFSQAHATTKWFPSLALCRVSVLWFLLQLSSLFVVPSLFLTVDALDVLMLFIVKWQSILHRCCFFKYINTYTG